jgi:xanthine dehydrogenase accessory factor
MTKDERGPQVRADESDAARDADQFRIPHSEFHICEGVAWLEEAARLNASGTPFVLATVVAREAPQSARSGSKALILPDATLLGWVGGGCVRPTVLRESLAALADGRPRLVRINPRAEVDARPDVRVYAMTCEGEGALDVYLEPVLPRLRLLVLGRTPVAEALAALARPLDISVRVVEPHAEAERFPGIELVTDYARLPALIDPRSYIVVATMGEADDAALRAALSADSAYVGLVASRKKAATLLDVLHQEGISRERLTRVKAPAGLDLGAVTPAEIALTILAEIVQLQRSGRASADSAAAAESLPHPVPETAASSPAAAAATGATVLDPVCGMAVEVRTVRHSYEVDGQAYYFCCPHCRSAFAKEPYRYL